MAVMRALAGIRLSVDTDESTSVERQTEAATYTVKARGDRLIHTAIDTDVSGSVSPFERPSLGPWLTDPDLIAQWDYLIVSKIDRLSRSLLDWQVFLQWCDAHGKTAVSVSEGFDLSTPWGRMIANILMIFAEFERLRIGERRKEAADKLRAIGQWGGGTMPYGYRAICTCHGKPECGAAQGWVFGQSAAEAGIIRRVVDDVLAGTPVGAICRELNAEGVPTPQRSREWRTPTLLHILRSRNLRGEAQYKKHTVRDADGNPVLSTDEPILTETEFALLQQALDAASRPHMTAHQSTKLLVGVVYCGECDGPLYRQRDTYRCFNRNGIKHPTAKIDAPLLEGIVEAALLKEHGSAQIERRAGNGVDYRLELETTRTELSELEEQYLGHNLSAERFARMSTRLEARIAELDTLAQQARGPRWERVGETVAQRWDRLDSEGRRGMLRRLGLRWSAVRIFRVSDRAQAWRVESELWALDEAHERLTRITP